MSNETTEASAETFAYTDDDGTVEIPAIIEGWGVSVHEASNCIELQHRDFGRVVLANLPEYSWGSGHYRAWKLFSLGFGAYGSTNVAVFANSLEDAVEESAAWLRDYAPGIFTDVTQDDIHDAQVELAEERGVNIQDMEDDDDLMCRVYDNATQDLTYTESGYIASWEWGFFMSEDSLQGEILQRVATTIGSIVYPE